MVLYRSGWANSPCKHEYVTRIVWFGSTPPAATVDHCRRQQQTDSQELEAAGDHCISSLPDAVEGIRSVPSDRFRHVGILFSFQTAARVIDPYR